MGFLPVTDNITLLHSFPQGEQPVSMQVYKDTLYVATNRRIYRLNEDGKLYPVKIAPA